MIDDRQRDHGQAEGEVGRDPRGAEGPVEVEAEEALRGDDGQRRPEQGREQQQPAVDAEARCPSAASSCWIATTGAA